MSKYLQPKLDKGLPPNLGNSLFAKMGESLLTEPLRLRSKTLSNSVDLSSKMGEGFPEQTPAVVVSDPAEHAMATARPCGESPSKVFCGAPADVV